MRARPGERYRQPRANDLNRANALLDEFERRDTPRPESSPAILRVLNTTANRIPRGGILGIKQTELLWDINQNESTFLTMPGFKGVSPRLKTFANPSVEDHRLHWVVALAEIEPDELGPCKFSGECWTRIMVRDANHLYATPVDDETKYGQTSAGGLARIVLIQDPYEDTPEPDPGRWALIDLQPAAPVRLEGYLEEDLDPPTLTTDTTVMATDGTITSGSGTLTTVTGTFTDDLDEVGVTVEIAGAGPSGTTLTVTAEFVDANTLTLSANASTSVTTAQVRRKKDTFELTKAKVRLREVRDDAWHRLSEFVNAVNPDHGLSLAAGTFVRVESWTKTDWRIYWSSCAPADAKILTKHVAIELP